MNRITILCVNSSRPGFTYLPDQKPNHTLFKTMKLSLSLLMTLAGLIAVPNTHAQEGNRGGGDRGSRRLPEELLKKYDKDSDGKLNDEEMKTFREARAKENLEKYDANKDGKLDEEETKKMEAENPRRRGFQPDAETLKKYDKNGDGKLDDEESKAWREVREKEMLAKYDADKDGKLSDEERRKGFDEERKLRQAKAAEGEKKAETKSDEKKPEAKTPEPAKPAA
jgi:Ca2+-binding EF-hand superfamily protein